MHVQREPSLNSQCSTLKALNTLLQQQLDGAREDLAQACAQVKVLQTHSSEAQRPQAPEQGAVAMLYGQLEKARAAQEALEKENEKIWAEVCCCQEECCIQLRMNLSLPIRFLGSFRTLTPV